MASSVSFLGAFVTPLMIFWIVLSGTPAACAIISFVRPSAVFLRFISSIVIAAPPCLYMKSDHVYILLRGSKTCNIISFKFL